MRKTKNEKFVKTEGNSQVYHTYKDRIFRMLFKEKDRLLELYNALNGTSYTQTEALEVNTLENAIFIKMKNDVSFIIESRMCLYEHQSSYNPNMPLRGMFYFADLYKKLVKNMDLSNRKHIKIPTPHYIVFYNGTEKTEEVFYQKLSEAFADGNEGCIELVVKVININYGKNMELMERCRTLSDYARFVAIVRENVEKTDVENAVKLAVEECIKKDVLKEFLLEQKTEVIAMSLYEYNEEYIRKTFFEEGEMRGVEKGEERFAKLVERLMGDSRTEDLLLATNDKNLRNKLYAEYHIGEN
ncbi:MAG: hypothetical protein IKY23_10510 [Lachnospiraceae bacterium]|nr:hypothetical protein [Lachnospiraceae bacterium]